MPFIISLPLLVSLLWLLLTYCRLVLSIPWFHIDWITQYSLSYYVKAFLHVGTLYFNSKYVFSLHLFSFSPCLPLFFINLFFLETACTLGSRSRTHLLSPVLCSCSQWGENRLPSGTAFPVLLICPAACLDSTQLIRGIYPESLHGVSPLCCPFSSSSVPQASPTLSSAWKVTEILAPIIDKWVYFINVLGMSALGTS